MRQGTVWLCFGLMALSACGDDKGGDKEAAKVVYATVKTVNAPKTDDVGDTTIEFTHVDQCSSDADSGFFQATFSAGNNKPTLAIRIKGFGTNAKTYNCSQANDNKSGAVGGKYNECAVEIQTLYSSSSSNLNKYTMYRDSESMKALDYTGSCEISTTYDKPRVKGTINCAKLVQTRLDGADRNPIDSSVTIDIAAESKFECDL